MTPAEARVRLRKRRKRFTVLSEDFFAAAEIAEVADVGDDEGDAELIFGADLAEVYPPVLEGEAAAAAVVTHLNDLALQNFVGEIVADPAGEVEAFAVFAAIAGERANLIRERLLKRVLRGRLRELAEVGIVVEAEVGDGGKEFAVRLGFDQGAYGDETLNLRIVLEDLLKIVAAARGDLEVAEDGRPITGTKRKREWRDGIERLKNVALADDDGSAEGGIKVVLLNDAPRKE